MPPNSNPLKKSSPRTSQHLRWACLLYFVCYAKRIFPDHLQISHACHYFWMFFGHATILMFCSLLAMCRIPCACHAKPHLNLQKCSAHVVFFCILTSKRASRDPRPSLFNTFDLQVCFAPAGLHFFKSSTSTSGPDRVCGNVLRATSVCTFSSLICRPGSARAALASLLFNLPEPQIIGETESSLFRDFLFFDLLTSLLFSDSSHLCLSSHKLPSLTQ